MISFGSFLLGCITSTGFFVSGFYFYRHWCVDHSQSEQPAKAFFPSFRKPQKKKPKAVSEEEQWKREQRETPSDPTYQP